MPNANDATCVARRTLRRSLPICALFLSGLAGCASSADGGKASGEGVVPAPTGATTSSAALQARAQTLSTDRMSAMGKLAQRHIRASVVKARRVAALAADDTGGTGGPGHHVCEHADDCDEGLPADPEANGGTLSETSIAVDATGNHIVIGYNDFRGFSLPAISLSGFSYSDDGGKTFVEGGQLPIPAGPSGAPSTSQIYGDPEIKYLGACSFVYASIYVHKLSDDPADPNSVQTMAVHRSTDCGHTWAGPFEVTAATNPGGTTTGGAPDDAADKEFLDVDPDTGRVLISWTNFTPVSGEISSSYSDDIFASPPTWSPRAVVTNAPIDGQGSIPRFAGNKSKNAYVAWGRFPSYNNEGVGFARSTDNGATWSAPLDLAPPNFQMDQILGNDRVHNFPSMAVDGSRGRHKGTVYVVSAPNDAHDGADVIVQRSTDEGLTFSAPLKLNSRIGADRAQWFPWVTVDSSTGRVYVFYYDQGIAKSGDLTETTYTWSDDGGVTWSRPRPMSDRPWRAGWGNDSGQPNLGDYNQIVAQNGELFAVYAQTHPIGFTDGEPEGTAFSVPSVTVKRIRARERRHDDTLQLGNVTFKATGADGNINPRALVVVKAPLVNYVTNPLNAAALGGVTSFLTSPTPGVTVLLGFSTYASIAPGETKDADLPFALALSKSFVPGTPIELEFHVGDLFSGQTTLHATLDTGTPVETVLLTENFDGVAPGALPAGWNAIHSLGPNVVPWTTSSTFCGTKSNAAFHVNASDGTDAAGNARFERLFAPALTIPADAEYVTVDFDVCYDTEDDPAFNIQAYDGLFLRFTDLTAGHKLRSVLAEAIETQLTTDGVQGYPKHMPRSSDPNYFEDMSGWAGDSGGIKHVHMKLPGMAGTTMQPRFEFTQDIIGTCADVRPGHDCGVLVDNVVVKSVVSAKAGK